MKIILIRHGQAENIKTTDEARALTLMGERQAQQTAVWLQHQGCQVDALFASPYVRAQQTAAFIAQTFNKPMILCDKITPDDSPMRAFEYLDSLSLTDDCVVVMVCHMPIVAKLAALLTGESVFAFDLAEAQLIEMPMFALGMGRIVARFMPNSL